MIKWYEQIQISEKVVIIGEKVVDYYWERPKYKVFSEISSAYELNEAAIYALLYLLNLQRNNLFHGDFKDSNFFWDYENRKVRSDAGSLIKMDDDYNAEYYIPTYTEIYSSVEHVTALKEKGYRNKEELMQEDIY